MAATITHYLHHTPVNIVRYGRGNESTFVHLHRSENTSLRAALKIFHRQRSRLITIEHRLTRNVRFRYQNTYCEFDPNRIFTAAGIRKTLARHHCYNPNTATIVKQFADQITGLFQSRTLIALHNTRYHSIQDYRPGHRYANNAQKVFTSKQSNPHDFFYVTNTADFQHFKGLGYNVVLQNKHGVTNDGSLSVYAARHGYRYINVEARHGHTQLQMKMIADIK